MTPARLDRRPTADDQIRDRSVGVPFEVPAGADSIAGHTDHLEDPVQRVLAICR